MLSPPVAKLPWGFDDVSGGAYRFAMGYAASLMLGWTALLIWLERRGVAALTVFVMCGLVLTANLQSGEWRLRGVCSSCWPDSSREGSIIGGCPAGLLPDFLAPDLTLV